MFSSRTRWNTALNRLAQLLRAKQMQGETIIDLTESNPTRCEFSYPADDILAAFADPSIVSYHPEPFGLVSARRAVAAYYSARGILVDPERIVLTASTSEAYTFLLKLLCNPGDNIIVPSPSYPLFEYICRLNDVELRHYRLTYDGEWRIDFESLENVLTYGTRAIVVVHPNNPTGSYVKHDELEKLGRYAVKRDCAIIADEVFEPYSLAPDGRRAKIMSCEKKALLFSLNGISKLLALPQLKISWIAVGGGSRGVGEALDRLEVIADTYLSVNTPAQVALPRLFQHLSLMGEQVCARLRSNYEALLRILEGSNISVYHLEGGWYAILRFPGAKTDDEWATGLLEREGVMLYPGHFFSFEQESTLVLSMILTPDVIQDGVERIRRFAEEQG
jgi:alanine-synthesizing transaminase